ncbi:MAG: dihydropteroate synthase, partial [Pseudomonadota bacterium]
MTRDPFAPQEWPLAHGRSLTLGPRGLLMGVLNVTPDSFSDGGKFDTVGAAVAQAKLMVQQGADIIDVGGESTKPDAEPVDGQTERGRILPVITALAAEGMTLSVDTYRAETAEAAVRAGAHIVNDVWGAQREPDIARIAAAHGAGLVLMHNSRDRDVLPNVIDDQLAFLRRSLQIANLADVPRENIVLDPGIGFGKDERANLA